MILKKVQYEKALDIFLDFLYERGKINCGPCRNCMYYAAGVCLYINITIGYFEDRIQSCWKPSKEQYLQTWEEEKKSNNLVEVAYEVHSSGNRLVGSLKLVLTYLREKLCYKSEKTDDELIDEFLKYIIWKANFANRREL
ncbi:MAG: hypothetical protein JHC30_08275 [Caldisericum sp.]|jgi:hypothetical protein|nr:hypothetical protein [Caldisericum sp.]